MLSRCRPLCALLLVAVLSLGAALAAAPAHAQTGMPPIREFRSAHFDLSVRIETRDVTLTVPGSGSFEVDPATRSVKMQMQMSAMGQSIELILLDQKLYLKAGANQPWQEVDTGQNQAANRSMMAMAPSQQIANLQRIASVTPAGTETIDGAATTKYTFTFNSQELANVFMMFPGMTGGRVGNPMTAQDQQMVAELLRNAQLNGEMWVLNDSQYLKRLRMNIVIQVPPGMGQGQAAMTSGQPETVREEITVTFSRFNEPVNIVAPPGAVPLTLPQQPLHMIPAQPAIAQPRPSGGPAPQTQMPRTMMGQPGPRPGMGPGMTTMPGPMTMPRTGDAELPLWPLGGLGLLLVGAGLGARRLGQD